MQLYHLPNAIQGFKQIIAQRPSEPETCWMGLMSKNVLCKDVFDTTLLKTASFQFPNTEWPADSTLHITTKITLVILMTCLANLIMIMMKTFSIHV